MALIQVHRFFQDVSGNKVYPGIYQAGDSALCGLGAQLVKDDFADYLPEDVSERQKTLTYPVEKDRVRFTKDAWEQLTPAIDGFLESDIVWFYQQIGVESVSKSDAELWDVFTGAKVKYAHLLEGLDATENDVRIHYFKQFNSELDGESLEYFDVNEQMIREYIETLPDFGGWKVEGEHAVDEKDGSVRIVTTDSNGNSQTSYQDAVGRQVDFTYHATDLMDEHGVTEQDMVDYFQDVDKFLKSHVEQYLEETSD